MLRISFVQARQAGHEMPKVRLDDPLNEWQGVPQATGLARQSSPFTF